MKKPIQYMLDVIESETKYTQSVTGVTKISERVMNVMGNVPRDEFVPEPLKAMAFNDGPLPIGHGQTISQPYIVALMTELLLAEKDHIILEIGTGSGYQTAILSQLCKKVYTVELISALSEEACAHFKKLHYDNIETRVGNGYEGWPEHAPYDSIIVTAAASHIPEALIEQLKPEGRLVIPVGLPNMHQELMLVTKNEDGQTEVKDILGVAFVPLRNAKPYSETDE